MHGLKPRKINSKADGGQKTLRSTEKKKKLGNSSLSAQEPSSAVRQFALSLAPETFYASASSSIK